MKNVLKLPFLRKVSFVKEPLRNGQIWLVGEHLREVPSKRPRTLLKFAIAKLCTLGSSARARLICKQIGLGPVGLLECCTDKPIVTSSLNAEISWRLDGELVRVLRDFGRLDELFAIHHGPGVHIVRVELPCDHHRVTDRLFTGHQRRVDDLTQFVRAASFVAVVPHATGIVEWTERHETTDRQSSDHEQTSQYDGDENHIWRAVRERFEKKKRALSGLRSIRWALDRVRGGGTTLKAYLCSVIIGRKPFSTIGKKAISMAWQHWSRPQHLVNWFGSFSRGHW